MTLNLTAGEEKAASDRGNEVASDGGEEAVAATELEKEEATTDFGEVVMA